MFLLDWRKKLLLLTCWCCCETVLGIVVGIVGAFVLLVASHSDAGGDGDGHDHGDGGDDDGDDGNGDDIVVFAAVVIATTFTHYGSPRLTETGPNPCHRIWDSFITTA